LKRIREHLDVAKPIKGLISLFESLLDEPNGNAFGCLLTNSAIEFAGPTYFGILDVQRPPRQNAGALAAMWEK